jgi:hypothetical protein
MRIVAHGDILTQRHEDTKYFFKGSNWPYGLATKYSLVSFPPLCHSHTLTELALNGMKGSVQAPAGIQGQALESTQAWMPFLVLQGLVWVLKNVFGV